jgi:hypothetical protein
MDVSGRDLIEGRLTILEFVMKDSGKPRKSPVRIAGLWAEI